MKPIPAARIVIAASLLFASGPAPAWGNEGHEIVAAIARIELTPDVRAKVDAILATDTDTLTGPDMEARATWADAWRGAGHRETASWHFVDIELAKPDQKTACFGYPAAASPASAGPAEDCVVDKIKEFTAELSAPNTAPAERLLALKYLLHFIGDIHQPLHSSDNEDRGGNCVMISTGGPRTLNLHSYWDTGVVEPLGSDPDSIGASLEAQITRKQWSAWRHGDAASWATETFKVAKANTYRIGSPAGCPANPAPITLPPGYASAAQAAAKVQLQRAGVRLAWVLNGALSHATIPTAARDQ